ncbi:GlxA family transcriptional regulator [Aromatoleum petrolei]|uniref:Helix-turn-helix domain-containing protein n=1 Tax=Aromatoleum petrolei TaxID=76116 RepID=A0ABX1MKX5_9RHOO|nr:GlxA family transcriptional regulator [Aromatoleum petrolei]NMF87298.1 helix-turn-helix domain-containing protein [Aromatoleum petrolei]QTQ38544.1 Transcriptional regulator, AraC family [Aromatoleum petrolei]
MMYERNRAAAGRSTEPGVVARPTRIGFLLLDNFTLIAHSSAIEPLRMANHLSGEEHYQWFTLSENGDPVRASDGQRILPDAPMDDAHDLDIVIVCGGVAQQQAIRKSHLSFLQAQARRGALIGGVCTGTWALAQAGLLDGYRASIHWECISGLQEAFPKVLVTNRLFTIEANRLTASGGTAPLDMMLNLIGKQHGRELMGAISEMFMCERIRNDQEQQRIPLRHVLGTSQPKLLEIVALMEANIEEPLELEDLAAIAGISRRQLERLFLRHLNCSPSRYYLTIRINRARQLLRQTSMMIIEVATACGFVSTPHFSKCYRGFFGVPPSSERTIEPVPRGARGRREIFIADESADLPDVVLPASTAELALMAARGEATYGSLTRAPRRAVC